jgi:UDP-N-acetylmuramoylalanine--D-glutamate ligase
MIDVASFRDRPIAVMGLGRSGLAAAEALIASGALLAAWDDGAAQRDAAAARGIPLTDLAGIDWSDIDTLVLSPGIPHRHPVPHPVAAAAHTAGASIVCDIELLFRSRPAAGFVGITGTNGKSTTTALIGHVLGAAGRDVETGGNLGPPALAMRPLERGDHYILELSSYQLERVPSVVFDVAVLLNISPDHLDRHGGMDGYVAAKARIFEGQSDRHTAIVGVDDDHSRAIYDRLRARRLDSIIPIAVGRPVAGGIYVLDGHLIDDAADGSADGLDLRDLPRLSGRHNWQNAAAAYAACRAVGLDAAAIAAGFATFPGLPHRLEPVATIDGIAFVNDSKATNAGAAETALECYDDIYWIAGGRAKAGGIAALAGHFDRVAHAFLIGEAADDFATTLDGKAPYTVSRTLPAAVRAAHDRAVADGRSGAVVLLSPAAASFDQFTDFAARGDAFRAAVRALDNGGGTS